jgi:hypothetical protein
MAVITGHIAVTSTAAKIVTPDADGCRLLLHTVGNADTYIGTSAVTVATGLLLDKDAAAVEIRLRPGDELWAICATTETLTYMILENA